MQCAKCGGQNPEDAFFCGTCGVQLRSSFETSGPVALQSAAPAADAHDTGQNAGAGQLSGPDTGSPPPNANPFTDAEPTARRAFEQRLDTAPVPPPPPLSVALPPASNPQPAWQPDAPGAGLAPPPPPPQVPQQAPPGAGYTPAPVGYQPGSYGMQMPPDGNTSGMGEGYPVPPEASGWTFAGFVPWGLFSFMNGNSTWGVIGLLLSVFSLSIVYSIYVGVTGRENAWRNRRFDSVQQYVDTMRAWNNWGIGLILLGVGFFVLYVIFLFAVIFADASKLWG